MKYVVLTVACLFCLAAAPLPSSTSAPTGTQWVQADSLGNAWGLYPLAKGYGDTKPLGPFVAYGTGHLVWIADFANPAAHHVWVRRYGGYGEVRISVDGKPVTGGKGGLGGGKYVWRELGTADIAAGSHHVDIDIDNCMFDAVLLTPAADYHPAKAQLPAPLADPVIRAPRHYRDDSDLAKAAGAAGIVVAKIDPYPTALNDWLPTATLLSTQLDFTGAINQYIPVDFAIRALKRTGDLPVSLTQLQGPDGTILHQSQIDLRVVQLHKRVIMLFRGRDMNALTPDFLLRDDRHGESMPGHQGGFGGGTCITSIPAHQSRQFHLVVHVPPHSPPGGYRGRIVIGPTDKPLLRLPVELNVMPLTLSPVQGWYSAFFRAQPMDKSQKDYMPPRAYLNGLKYQALLRCAIYRRGGPRRLRVVRFDSFGEPIPTLRWEAWRDGIDDVRYLQALDRAIAQGQARIKQADAPPTLKQALEDALATRKTYFDSIDDSWFRYLQALNVEHLDKGRQAMAQATISLREQLP